MDYFTYLDSVAYPGKVTIIANDSKSKLPKIVLQKALENTSVGQLEIKDDVCISQIEEMGPSISGLELSNEETIPIHSNTLLASFCGRRINPVTYRMFNDACLVTDNRLIIDNKFKTNDINIFAAGSCTSYARHYFAEKSQSSFNSQAIGQNLSEIFMKTAANKVSLCKLDPQGDLSKLPDLENARTVPENLNDFPLILSGTLPNNFEYFCVRHIDFDQKEKSDIESVSKSGDRYMKISLDLHGKIVGITAARNDGVKISKNNLQSLFNLQEKIVHNLKERWEAEAEERKGNQDLFEFLKTPSLKSIYHDRFDALLDSSIDLIQKSEMKDKINDLFDGLKLNVENKKALMEEYQGSDLKKKVEDMVDSFLSYNSNLLPMYAKPGMT